MIAIKGMEIQTDCKKCPLMATDGLNELSPMMCFALWATKHKVEHCISGKILDDCPLIEIVNCENCIHWDKYSAIRERDPVWHYCNMEYCSTPDDYFCGLGKRREN